MRTVFLLLALMACFSRPSLARETLTTIAGIRALTPEEADSSPPVSIRGVVTFSNENVITLFIHDGKNGVYLDQGDLMNRGLAVWPEPGDQVEVSGVSGNGIFAPLVYCTSAPRIIGKVDLPTPRVVDGLDLAEPGIDCDWVTVEADVTDVLKSGEAMVVHCRAGSCDFHVLVEGPLSQAQDVLWDLPDRRVRIRGVVATVFNASGQMTRRFLRVNTPEDVVPLPGPDRRARCAWWNPHSCCDWTDPDRMIG